MSPSEQYQQRQHQFDEQAHRYQIKFNQLAWLRVILFILSVSGTYFFYDNYGAIPAVSYLIVSVSAFAFCLKKHNQIEYQRNHYRFLSFINRDEAARLQNQFIREDTGEAYVENNHFYTSDLDIFGQHSIYKLLNRTHTFGGAHTLAQWLKIAASADEITRRQQAVADLTPRLEWRQSLEANAMHFKEVIQPTHNVVHWMALTDTSKQLFRMKIARFLPLITIPLFIGWSFNLVPFQLVFLFILFHLLILRSIFKKVKEICDKTTTVSKTLLSYASIITLIENEKFTSNKLQDLQSVFGDGHTTASHAIRQFAVILRNLNYRDNAFFYAIVGILSLWDLQFLVRTEAWQLQHREDLPRWLEAVAEWETLNSIAGFSFANPDFTLPVISREPMELQAKALGHVLIREGKRVSNDIEFSGLGKSLVITGSNMSGKSTFLRTVGVNMVLALAGAPVCAQAFKVSVVQLFTSMRTQDSLEESVSSFYAELKRLKQLIERMEQPQPVMYFLDEILKGTNSQDRHNGAKALIRQLHQHNASGFISTHDLELGRMEDEHPDFVGNYSFNSEVIDGKLFFDYTLRKGICHSFNASELMKQIGIEM